MKNCLTNSIYIIKFDVFLTQKERCNGYAIFIITVYIIDIIINIHVLLYIIM